MTASQKQIRVNPIYIVNLTIDFNLKKILQITHKLRRLDHSKTDINNDSTGFSNDVNLLQRKKNSRKIK